MVPDNYLTRLGLNMQLGTDEEKLPSARFGLETAEDIISSRTKLQVSTEAAFHNQAVLLATAHLDHSRMHNAKFQRGLVNSPLPQLSAFPSLSAFLLFSHKTTRFPCFATLRGLSEPLPCDVAH